MIEYAGSAVRGLSMEGRMTICNMSIEGGARAGMIAPDDTTFAYLEGGPALRPEQSGNAGSTSGVDSPPTRMRPTTPRSRSTSESSSRRSPGGRTPGWSRPWTGAVPDPDAIDDPDDRAATERALAYMDLEPGTPIREIHLDRVFIGSCTNARIEDLRVVAAARRRPTRPPVGARDGRARIGRRAASGRGGGARPPSSRRAGFEWRRAGCSMCLGMNPDIARPRRALRFDVEPELRGPPGPRRPHPPRQPGDGRRRRSRRPLRRRP